MECEVQIMNCDLEGVGKKWDWSLLFYNTRSEAAPALICGHTISCLACLFSDTTRVHFIKRNPVKSHLKRCNRSVFTHNTSILVTIGFLENPDYLLHM